MNPGLHDARANLASLEKPGRWLIVGATGVSKDGHGVNRRCHGNLICDWPNVVVWF